MGLPKRLDLQAAQLGRMGISRFQFAGTLVVLETAYKQKGPPISGGAFFMPEHY